jgi:hypothetical protein
MGTIYSKNNLDGNKAIDNNKALQDNSHKDGYQRIIIYYRYHHLPKNY